MATKRPAKPHRTLLQEAADPATNPERLGELAYHDDEAVRRAAWKNPSLPEDEWREVLRKGQPEAWANPLAPFYVLAWTPREDNSFTLDAAARWAMEALWEEPERCSPEGKDLLAAKIQTWWSTCNAADDMLKWFAQVARNRKGLAHKQLVLTSIACVRTCHDLPKKSLRVLTLLKTWAQEGEDRRYEARRLADDVYRARVAGTVSSESASAVLHLTEMAIWDDNLPTNAYHLARNTAQCVAMMDTTISYIEAKSRHLAMLADLIREEVPEAPLSMGNMVWSENPTTAKRDDENLWQRVKAKILAGNRGGNPGQWSARKAQLAVKEYKDAGGGYIGEKDPDNSLTRWTEQKWTTRSGKKSLESGERYLPEDAIKNISKKEYEKTSRAKSKGMKKGIQFVKQPKEISDKVKKYR
jgi:hypothetical protein